MRALLDVNVLIALHDREHVHRERAALWLESNIAHGWASFDQRIPLSAVVGATATHLVTL